MSKKNSDLIPTESRNLYFDIGNSVIKLCYREQGKWVDPVKFRKEQSHSLMNWLTDVRQHFDCYIISSVRPDKNRAFHQGLGNGKNILLRNDQIPGNYLNYESRETLGIDRFLVAAGAWSIQEGSCVVVDAGTACTVDYINEEGVYEGGAILPGLSILEQGIQQYTPELPEVERKIPSRWPGKNTRECLQWGILGGFMDAIENALKRYEQFGDFTLFITGGNADILAHSLNRMATKDKRLIFKGMEYFINEIID